MTSRRCCCVSTPPVGYCKCLAAWDITGYVPCCISVTWLISEVYETSHGLWLPGGPIGTHYNGQQDFPATWTTPVQLDSPSQSLQAVVTAIKVGTSHYKLRVALGGMTWETPEYALDVNEKADLCARAEILQEDPMFAYRIDGGGGAMDTVNDEIRLFLHGNYQPFRLQTPFETGCWEVTLAGFGNTHLTQTFQCFNAKAFAINGDYNAPERLAKGIDSAPARQVDCNPVLNFPESSLSPPPSDSYKIDVVDEPDIYIVDGGGEQISWGEIYMTQRYSASDKKSGNFQIMVATGNDRYSGNAIGYIWNYEGVKTSDYKSWLEHFMTPRTFTYRNYGGFKGNAGDPISPHDGRFDHYQSFNTGASLTVRWISGSIPNEQASIREPCWTTPDLTLPTDDQRRFSCNLNPVQCEEGRGYSPPLGSINTIPVRYELDFTNVNWQSGLFSPDCEALKGTWSLNVLISSAECAGQVPPCDRYLVDSIPYDGSVPQPGCTASDPFPNRFGLGLSFPDTGLLDYMEVVMRFECGTLNGNNGTESYYAWRYNLKRPCENLNDPQFVNDFRLDGWDLPTKFVLQTTPVTPPPNENCYLTGSAGDPNSNYVLVTARQV